MMGVGGESDDASGQRGGGPEDGESAASSRRGPSMGSGAGPLPLGATAPAPQTATGIFQTEVHLQQQDLPPVQVHGASGRLSVQDEAAWGPPTPLPQGVAASTNTATLLAQADWTKGMSRAMWRSTLASQEFQHLHADGFWLVAHQCLNEPEEASHYLSVEAVWDTVEFRRMASNFARLYEIVTKTRFTNHFFKHIHEGLAFMLLVTLSAAFPKQRPKLESEGLRMMLLDMCSEWTSGMRFTDPRNDRAWYFAYSLGADTDGGGPSTSKQQQTATSAGSAANAGVSGNYSDLLASSSRDNSRAGSRASPRRGGGGDDNNGRKKKNRSGTANHTDTDGSNPATPGGARGGRLQPLAAGAGAGSPHRRAVITRNKHVLTHSPFMLRHMQSTGAHPLAEYMLHITLSEKAARALTTETRSASELARTKHRAEAASRFNSMSVRAHSVRRNHELMNAYREGIESTNRDIARMRRTTARDLRLMQTQIDTRR